MGHGSSPTSPGVLLLYGAQHEPLRGSPTSAAQQAAKLRDVPSDRCNLEDPVAQARQEPEVRPALRYQGFDEMKPKINLHALIFQPSVRDHDVIGTVVHVADDSFCGDPVLL